MAGLADHDLMPFFVDGLATILELPSLNAPFAQETMFFARLQVAKWRLGQYLLPLQLLHALWVGLFFHGLLDLFLRELTFC